MIHRYVLRYVPTYVAVVGQDIGTCSRFYVCYGMCRYRYLLGYLLSINVIFVFCIGTVLIAGDVEIRLDDVHLHVINTGA